LWLQWTTVAAARSRNSTCQSVHAIRRFRHAPAATASHSKHLEAHTKVSSTKKDTKAESSYGPEKLDPELEFAAEELELLGGAPLPKIGLGDWVEAHRHGRTYSGLVVSQKPIKGGLQMIGLITRSGRVYEFGSDNIPFSIPNFLQLPNISKMIKSGFQLDRDGSSIPEPPVTDFRRIAKTFEDRIKFLQATRLAQFGGLHQHFVEMASADGVLVARLDDMAKFIFDTDRPNAEQMYATHMYVSKDNIRFTASPNVRGSGDFLLRPTKEANGLEWIISSVRSTDENFSGFLSRAREAVQYSNAHRDPTTGVMDVKTQGFPTFSKNDKKFIDFIVEWVIEQKFALSTPHEIFAPSILKALKCYENTHIEKDVAAQFLRDIGMWQPWDNMTLLQEAPSSVEHFWSKKAEDNERIMQKGEQDIQQQRSLGGLIDSPQSLGPHEFYSKDICDRIRHDFGDLTVYTIDDPSAKEIDDGVSIETRDGHTWVHIHVADPSAYIHPANELANVMAARIQTLYLPERHFPLLPESLSSKKFSLIASNSDTENRQYTLSFSAKVDGDGNLVNAVIRPGLVRNICKLSYDHVDAMLDGLESSDASSKTALSRLAAICQSHLKQRVSKGAINFDRPEPSIHLNPYPLPLPSLHFDKPDFQQTVPAIDLSVRKGAQSQSRSMVAECMIMAGRIASSVCADRGIPMVYRTQAPPNMESVSAHEKELLDSVLSKRNPSDGSITISDAFKILRFMNPGSVTTQPGRSHWMMGISDGYAKVTSPLRRYLDIVAHWQLKASLLNEPLPFSEDLLKTMGVRADMREKQLNRQSALATDWWITETLRREQAVGSLRSKVWECIISNEGQTIQGRVLPASAFIPSLGITGKMDPAVNQSFQVGETVNVVVKNIDPITPRFTVEPVS